MVQNQIKTGSGADKRAGVIRLLVEVWWSAVAVAGGKALTPLLFGLFLALASTAAAQVSQPSDQGSDRQVKPTGPSVDHYLDRILNKAAIAAGAADIIKEADKYRREAEQMLKDGRIVEARSLLRRAGEAVAETVPEGDAKLSDPLLREYLRDITAKLLTLEPASEEPSPDVSAPTTVAGNSPIENYATQPRVAAFINYFQGRGRQRLDIGRARLASYRPMMARIFSQEGVPEWLLALGFVESTYSPTAHSPAQAHGIWQFIPGTGAHYGLLRTAYVDERGNPEKSTRAAARYLRDLHALFGDWLLAMAAYNSGEGRVARVIRRTGVRDFWTMAERGLLPQETINYVPSILAASYLLGTSGPPQGNQGAGAPPQTRAARTVFAANGSSEPADSELARPATAEPESGAAAEGERVSAPGDADILARMAARYNVPASEIRQTKPGYYDIPSVWKGRRTYVRVRGR